MHDPRVHVRGKDCLTGKSRVSSSPVVCLVSLGFQSGRCFVIQCDAVGVHFEAVFKKNKRTIVNMSNLKSRIRARQGEVVDATRLNKPDKHGAPDQQDLCIHLP